MALVIAMQEGRSFFVGDRKVTVERIETPTRVKLRIHGAMDALVSITDTNRVEVYDGVYVMVGLGTTVSLAKIAIEAPRNVRILRDSLYGTKPNG